MVRFRGSAPSLLCLCTCDTARRCLPTDLNPDGPDGPVERDGGIHDAPLQLRMGPQAEADIVLHDAVVQHARFRRGVQPDREVTDPRALRLRLFQHPMEELVLFCGSRLDYPPGFDPEPRPDDRASREWNRISPANLPFDRLRTDRRLETTRGQRRSNESSVDVLGADDAVAKLRGDVFRLEPQVGPRGRIDSDLLPPPKRPDQRAAFPLDFLQVHGERLVIAAMPFLVVEAVRLGTLRREAPNRQVDVPDPSLPPRFGLSGAPQLVPPDFLGGEGAMEPAFGGPPGVKLAVLATAHRRPARGAV